MSDNEEKDLFEIESPEQPNSEAPEELEDEQEPERKPALVLNIYSLWTPILAVLMLIVGLLAGYFARPYIQDRITTSSPSAPSSEVAQVEGTPQPTVDPIQVAESRAQMMEFLVGQTVHFKGDESAPITLIEFSDFQ